MRARGHITALAATLIRVTTNLSPYRESAQMGVFRSQVTSGPRYITARIGRHGETGFYLRPEKQASRLATIGSSELGGAGPFYDGPFIVGGGLPYGMGADCQGYRKGGAYLLASRLTHD